MKYGFLTALLFLSAGCSSNQAEPEPAVNELHYGVTAHRGNSGSEPENTMAAFKSAVELNADWVELDIHKTGDGKIVVIHDKTTGRTGDLDLVVANSSYDELRAVDVSTDFMQRKGDSYTKELTEDARRIPLLDEVLEYFTSVESVRLSIQPKTDAVEQAVELVKRYGLEHSVGFNDGNLNYMKQVKELAPEIHVFWDRPADLDIDKDIEIALEHGFESLVINQNGITPEVVRKVKDAGLEIGSWTVNDPDIMEKFLDIGVERIYTDYPDILIEMKSTN